ncbi:hypothetical protein BDV19DRAFT_379204 [Aspergillus venezuelensis]
MSWTQGNHWSRPFDCHDKLWQFVSKLGKPVNRENWLLMGVVELGFPSNIDPVASLSAAWKALCLRHPDIALEMTANVKRYYPLLNPTDLNDWCNHTFRIETNLCLVSAHWRWDGCSLYMVLHDLLSELENLTPLPETLDGSEAQNLVPTLDVLCDRPTIHRSPHCTLSKATIHPCNFHRAQISFSAEQTASLRQACREKGLSLSAAIHASAVTATVALNTTSPASRYTSWAIFDIRKYCSPPFNGPIHGPYLRMPIYKQDWSPGVSDMIYTRVPFVEKAVAAMNTQADAASELGVQELSQQLLVHCWSWMGGLVVSASYNEAYYERPDVEEFFGEG